MSNLFPEELKIINDRGLKFIPLQYQDKTLRIVPTGAATNTKVLSTIIHNLLRGNVTINILFIHDNKVLITQSKNERLKTQGS